jgi:hypothetical protein
MAHMPGLREMWEAESMESGQRMFCAGRIKVLPSVW